MISITLLTLKKWRDFVVLSVLLFVLISVSNVTIANDISGVVNDYSVVNSINNQTVTVSNAASFAVNDTVMLMQMRGATIFTHPNYYGEIDGWGNTGQFEIATITQITGNDISLDALTKTFDTANAVQLIKVSDSRGQGSTTLTSTVTASAWDGEQGGVVAIMADNLIMNADINVVGKGFWGGRYYL